MNVNYYWVNIGSSFNEVKRERFLWAPTHSLNKDGRRTVSSGWKHMSEISKGDIIICNRDRQVIYVAVAKSNAYLAERPRSRVFDEWKMDGVRVDVELFILPAPFKANQDFRKTLSEFNGDCDPKLITDINDFTQQYLISLPAKAGDWILREIGYEQLLIDDPEEDDDFQTRVQASTASTQPEGPRPVGKKGKGTGSSSWPRNPSIAKEAMEKGKYICAVSSKHETFISKATGKPFVEAHHLVPMGKQGDYVSSSLDVTDNIVPLCPACHRHLHFAKLEEIMPIITTLFKSREQSLLGRGINISLKQLLEMY